MDGAGPSSSEAFRPHHRLRRSRDFLRCYRRGRRRHGVLVNLHFARGEPGSAARLGMTVSRKVGKSVIRHKIKRRIREIFRRWPARSRLSPVDVVVHVKPTAAGADFESLREEIESLLATLLPRFEGKP